MLNTPRMHNTSTAYYMVGQKRPDFLEHFQITPTNIR